jgi:molybdopterin synthase sulfur carrier subunit
MPHVTFTPHLRRFFPDLADGVFAGTTVREVIADADRRHPGLASYILDDTGRLRRHVNVFIGVEPIADRSTLGDALKPDDNVSILQALSGG